MAKRTALKRVRSVNLRTGRVLCTGDLPLYGLAPTRAIPESLRRVFSAASDGHRVFAAEADFTGISFADLTVERVSQDVRSLADAAKAKPKKFKELLTSLHDARKVAKLARDLGLEQQVKHGEMMNCAVFLTRVLSVVLTPRDFGSEDIRLSVGPRQYMPIQGVKGMDEAVRTSILLGIEFGAIRGMLISPEALAVSVPDADTCLADFAYVRKIVEEHPIEIEEILKNFHNDAKVREIARKIGLTEEGAIRNAGGLGCLILVLIIIFVVLICIIIAFW